MSEQLKAGHKVWVLCEVAMVYNHESLYVDIRHDGAVFEAKRSDCRTVEPQAKEPTRGQKLAQQALKGIWAANDSVNESPVIKDCLTTESNSPEIPDSSSEPIAPSPCMDGVDVDQFVEGVMEARGRASDPINPGHYKQGGIECIEAIKAATGDGFIGYVWGNVLKYLWRWPKKGGVDDLKKARWYLDRLISEVGE